MQRDRGRACARRGDDGRERRARTRRPRRSPRATRGVALIHQELSLCAHLTVAENVLLGREPRAAAWLDRAAMRREAARLLESFDAPGARIPIASSARCRSRPARSSRSARDGGRRAHRADGRADQQPAARGRRAAVRAHPAGSSASGVTVVYISHFLEEVREIADRFTVLRDGRSVATGTLAGRHERARSSRTWSDARSTRLFPERAARQPRRRRARRRRRPPAPPACGTQRSALRRGEILGIAGLVGAGRTETAARAVGPRSGPKRARSVGGRPPCCAAPHRRGRVSAPGSAT